METVADELSSVTIALGRAAPASAASKTWRK